MNSHQSQLATSLEQLLAGSFVTHFSMHDDPRVEGRSCPMKHLLHTSSPSPTSLGETLSKRTAFRDGLQYSSIARLAIHQSSFSHRHPLHLLWIRVIYPRRLVLQPPVRIHLKETRLSAQYGFSVRRRRKLHSFAIPPEKGCCVTL